MKKCKIEKRLVPYAHGAMSSRDCERIEQHLAKCKVCAETLRLLRVLDKFQAPAVADGPDIWPELKQRILARARVPWWRTRPAMALGVTGVFCAVLIAGAVRLRPHPGIGPKPIIDIVKQAPPSEPVPLASIGDIITGFPANFHSEMVSRSKSETRPNPNPQLSGLMTCLGSPLMQTFGPVGTQPERAPGADEPASMGSDPGVNEPPTSVKNTVAHEGPIQEGDELVVNGDFEELRAGLPVAWYSSSVEEDGLRFCTDDKTSCWGKRSSVIDRSTSSGDTDATPNNWAQDIFRVPEGRIVHLTAYVRTRDVGVLDRKPAGSSYASVAVQCWDKDKKRILAFTSTQATAGQIQRHTDWSQYAADLRIPEGTGAITVRATLVGNGKAWFDGVSLKVGPETPATGVELLANGGFEEKDPNRIVPIGWFQAQRPGWPSLRFYRDAFVKHGGEASATILNGSAANKDGNNWAQVVLNPPVGKKLRLVGYVRSAPESTDFNVSLGLQCLDDSMNKPIAEQVVKDAIMATSSEGWRRLETSVTVPEGTSAVVVRAVARGAGRAWFDDLSLRKE